MDDMNYEKRRHIPDSIQRKLCMTEEKPAGTFIRPSYYSKPYTFLPNYSNEFKVSNFMTMLALLTLRLLLILPFFCNVMRCVRGSAAPLRDLSEDFKDNDEVGEDEVPKMNEIFQPIVDVLFAQDCVDPPDSCPNENVTFWLYTRSTQDNPSLIDITDVESLNNLKYGKDDPWKLIIHGYTGHKDYSPNSELRPAYFQKGDYNIISVDYQPLVREPCYIQSVFNVPLIANCTSLLIDTMVEEGIFRLEDLHVIGFSLGGQVSGHLSRYLKSGTLKRITGLDPALPLFIGSALGKLDESDAEFVDVIHTDAGRKGKLERSGHVDFYPNGGYSQIGCIDTENLTLSGCNHVRAAYYFAESITSDVGFWGIPCRNYVSFYLGFCIAQEDDLVIMGEYTPPIARGTYYLETNTYPPYALGKKYKVLHPIEGDMSSQPDEFK